MLVILADEQILSPQQVCQGCLMASQSGLPRWHQGKLGCGRALRLAGCEIDTRSKQPDLYECQMGFRLADIE
ncbi:MAG: hypothetical protein SAL07_10310 [Oscillatoria sp. PMC 1051.18]|uniref:hypothetical protein n=1 Tax=Oscillatoria salina TaxID=331517 RepID=UPI0013B66A2A|nr:hypothetical protein [Oscillatoria salina]MBZ8182359.1 hypothetical protein [Oscillatoria salina IIICB1]MEC4895316.1 hypothetical protein [Oscillatoria sp. PMC 1050.18]MEC5030295.1 hypothetical protein [Oscillatoria sp. PMC 1051.18]NET87932.1 hypothetical protein [Kamptonema sp. SIO1D9]